MRKCSKCGEVKPESEFYVKDPAHGWLHSQCKECKRAAQRRYRQENLEACRMYDRLYSRKYRRMQAARKAAVE